jgi:hypothetical protein
MKRKSAVSLNKSLIRWRGSQKLERVRQIASRSGQSINQMVNSWADTPCVRPRRYRAIRPPNSLYFRSAVGAASL